MIPYEDLVAALASWRAKNGLPTGPADYLGEPPPPAPVSFAASFEGHAAPPAAEGEPPAEADVGLAEGGYGEGGFGEAYAESGFGEGGFGEGDFADGALPDAGDEIVDLSEDSNLLEASVLEESAVEQVMPEAIYEAEEAEADYVVPFSSADEPAAAAGAAAYEPLGEAVDAEGGELYDLDAAEGMVEEEYPAPADPGADPPAPPPSDPTAQMWTGDLEDPPFTEPPLAEPPPADDDDPERQGS